MLGAFHGICGIAALFLGAWIFARPKGTTVHVRLGWLYVASMLCLNGSSLFIYHLTRGPNLFHAIALAEIFLVVTGVIQIRYRSRLRRSLWRHYQYMCWSYVALVAATLNEAFVRVGALRALAAHTTAALPLLASALIVAISAVVIFRAQTAFLRVSVLIPFRERLRESTAGGTSGRAARGSRGLGPRGRRRRGR